MAMSLAHLGRDPAYDRFLGAVVGKDQAGSSVSVLSMLARLGVDPWMEASDLAGMQEAPARQRLEALLARFEDVPTLVSDQSSIARKLLVFLPNRARSAGPSAQGRVALPLKLPVGRPFYWMVAVLIILGWIAALAQGN